MENKEDLKQPGDESEIPSIVQNVLRKRLTRTFDLVKTAFRHIVLCLFIWCLGYFHLSLLWVFVGVFVYIYITDKRKSKSATSLTQPTSINANPEEVLKSVTEIFRLSGSQVPSWVYFPDVEKAEWINNILHQLWPYIGEYVKTMITEQVQPSIRESSALLSSFTFTDVDLGEKPPYVAGVKVYGDHHTRRNEIIMDFQVIVDSECNIGVSVNRLQAGICNLRVTGVLRVELQPLVGIMPLVGAASVAFVKDPMIDFDLTHLANLLDFPGFDLLLKAAISDSVAAMFVLPEKYVVKLCPDIDLRELRYPLPKGVVRIHVLSAENLEEKDSRVLGFGGGSDPYVTVKVGHKQKFRTRTVAHNLNPVWNETFDAVITNLDFTKIEFTLFDDDGALNKADYLGCASLPAKCVHACGCVDEVITLSDVERGKLHVRLEWFDLSTNIDDLKEASQLALSYSNSYCSLLNIYVDSAQHLPLQQDTCHPTPVLKITVPGKEPLKTKVASQTNNPVWEENFQIFLRNPSTDIILFELKDKSNRALRSLNKKYAKIKQGAMAKAFRAMSGSVTSFAIEDGFLEVDTLGYFKYAIQNLLEANEMTVHRPFDLQNSGAQSVLHLRMSLRIFKLKSQSSPHSGIRFTVTAPKPTLPATTKKELADENQNLPVSNEASNTPSESELSTNNSNTSVEFKGSPTPNAANRNGGRVNLSRTASVASEISHVGEVGDLRKRLNAKLKQIGNGDEQLNCGLGRVKLTIRYRKNTLVVLVICAENLIVCDEQHQTSDPYVRVYIIPSKSGRKKTKVVKNNLNPKYDERLEFTVSPSEVGRKKLNVTVKNQTGFLSSEKVLMGQVIINLSEFDLSQPTTAWYHLKLPDET